MDYKRKSGIFAQTADYQAMYESLLKVCDSEGTMIVQDRLLEKDVDIFPHKFFRRGTREYIFPKQEVKIKEDSSHIIDPTPNYELKTEEQKFKFDESKVKGKIRINYNDSGSCPILELKDAFGESELPKKVIKTIDDIFKQ